MPKLSIQDLDLNGKTVLMRVDFNVPLNNSQEITDDTRIQAALPSIRHVLDHGGALILMSHLGRPKGEFDEKLSLAPCAKRLSELIGKPVLLGNKHPKPGEVSLLENLRFDKGEKNPEGDPDFVKNLAKLGDCYVNDAFGTAHRKHASTYALPKAFPTASAAGFLMEKEIAFLGNALESPKRPFIALIGGAKISTKLGVLRALLEKVDRLLIGGGMAYTFFKAQGKEIGNSIFEEDLIQDAKEILKMGKDKILLPVDTLVADRFSEEAAIQVVEGDIPEGFEGVSIGPKTVALFEEELKKAKTVIWNGPMGVFEIAAFAKGTFAIAKAMAKVNGTTIVGGGDSVAAVKASGVANSLSHISTGGGASLEYIEKGQLPGIEILTNVVK